MAYEWELIQLQNWSVNDLRNWIWMAVDSNQAIPGCVSVEALREELVRRGEKTIELQTGAIHLALNLPEILIMSVTQKVAT